MAWNEACERLLQTRPPTLGSKMDGAALQKFYGDTFDGRSTPRTRWPTALSRRRRDRSAAGSAGAAGGKTVLSVTEIPDMVTFALFNDPSGNLVGLVKG